MYDKRIRIFILVIAAFLVVCLLRLTQIQLLPNWSVQDEVAELKRQRGHTLQLKTIRGRILDRKGKVLAADHLQFQLCINYKLTARTEDIEQVIEKCTHFGLTRSRIETQIAEINRRIWNLRTFVAWMRAGPDPAILEKYNHNINSIPLSEAIADFERKFPDKDKRLSLVSKVNDIAEIDKDWPLVELKTDDDIFTAQLEFADVDGVRILPKGQRSYSYGTVAAQTIGWVGPATQEEDKVLFADDKFSSYLDGEVCGREDGAEFVCETILRGKRGEVVYDIDRELVNRTETQFGEDVSLTLDAELQKRIEEYLADGRLNPNYKAPTAAVVLDVATGDILALVSMPVFDLNQIRADYAALAADPNEPLRNRAINKQYPPGSSVKPLILIAGLESGKITADEVISCPAQKAPSGWPNCWIFNRYSLGHDSEGANNAHNATKGSCNIYFSHLADRINPQVLQQWLFKFGYGQETALAPAIIQKNGAGRNFRQTQGQISNLPPKTTIQRFESAKDVYGGPPLTEGERRWFGIGQGNLRVTPLQVANAMAAIARGGILKQPRLFKEILNSDEINLGISTETLKVVYDGMSAVVNEPGGTAYKEFANSGLARQGIKIYGKTGSTEKPDNAWFAGFAADSADRKIVIAVLVEGGQHGSSDAAPLARDIIQFCIDAGYIGKIEPRP
jgi:penicillin-binding protein 2